MELFTHSKTVKSIPGNLIYSYYQHLCPYQVKQSLLKGRPETPPNALQDFFINRGVRREEVYFDLLKKRLGEDCALITSDDSLNFEEDLAQRAQATVEAMKEGKSVICHGILTQRENLTEFAHQITQNYPDLPFLPLFRGEPDIIYKKEIDGESAFGTYMYEIGDVKSSYTSKFCQQMQVTYYSYLLEDLQGILPDHGYIITQGVGRDFAMEYFEVEETIWSLRHLLEEEIWEWILEEEVFYHIRSKCQGCDFFHVCTEEARQKRDVSLIPNLRRAQKKALYRGGIQSLEELAKASDRDLKELRFPGVRAEGLLPLRQQARALVKEKPLYRPPKTSPTRATEEISTHVKLDNGYRAIRSHIDLKREDQQILYLDFVHDPYWNEQMGCFYLPQREEEAFSFFSSRVDLPGQRDISHLFEELLGRIEKEEDFVLVHYGGRLQRDLQELALAQDSIPQSLLEEFLVFHFLDLKKLYLRVLSLPVYSYDLEEVANTLQKLTHPDNEPFFSPGSFDGKIPEGFTAEDTLTASSSLLLRLYLESEAEEWLPLLIWRKRETLRATHYLYQTITTLKDSFPHL